MTASSNSNYGHNLEFGQFLCLCDRVPEVYKLKAQGSGLKAKKGIIPLLCFQL